MTTNSTETYHDEVLDHLYAQQSQINRAINTVHKLRTDGSLFTPESKTTLVNAVRSAHPDCAICASYQGNSRA